MSYQAKYWLKVINSILLNLLLGMKHGDTFVMVCFFISCLCLLIPTQEKWAVRVLHGRVTKLMLEFNILTFHNHSRHQLLAQLKLCHFFHTIETNKGMKLQSKCQNGWMRAFMLCRSWLHCVLPLLAACPRKDLKPMSSILCPEIFVFNKTTSIFASTSFHDECSIHMSHVDCIC